MLRNQIQYVASVSGGFVLHILHKYILYLQHDPDKNKQIKIFFNYYEIFYFNINVFLTITV